MINSHMMDFFRPHTAYARTKRTATSDIVSLMNGFNSKGMIVRTDSHNVVYERESYFQFGPVLHFEGKENVATHLLPRDTSSYRTAGSDVK